MRISVNHVFERRIGLFPAGFDADGVLFCNQNFADYPMVVPDGPFDPWRDAFAGWMLLSYHKSVVTSSEADGRPGSLAVNEDIRSWWTAGSPEEGEWIQVDLGADRVVAAIQVNLADAGVARFAPRCADGRPVIDALRAVYPDSEPTEMLIEVSEDGVVWQAISDTRGSGVDAPHRMTVLESPRPARFVRVTAGRMPFGSPFAVSGLRVFGTKEGPLPVDVEVMSARVDQLTAELQWVPVAGADGYNVRYGLAPDKLYHSWMVYDRTRLQLPTLTAGRDYWVAVDSFGETGITEGGNPRWSLPREHGEREQAAQQLGAIPILGTAVQQSESLTSMGPRGGPSPRGGEVAVERCMQPDAAAPSHDSNPRTP